MITKDGIFIGVCGGSASGKTTICENIVKHYKGNAQLISLDSYYKDRSHLTDDEVKKVNFDHPDSLDIKQLYRDIMTLKETKTVNVPQYCFKTHSVLKEKTNLKIKNINIIEGLYTFLLDDLRDLFDLKIYIHADDDIRLVRRIRRDVEYRARSITSILDQYVTSVKPMNDKYVVTQKSFSDTIIDTTSSSGSISGADLIINQIEGLSH